MKKTKANDVWGFVTERILAQLERGDIPWRKPWKVSSPKNFTSKRAYRGVNAMMLAIAPYSCEWWVTMHQCNQLGGKVKEGEHGTMIVFFKPWVVDEVKDGQTVKKTIPILRYSLVWNLEQTTLEIPKGDKVEHKPIEECEAVVNEFFGRDGHPTLIGSPDRAFYRPPTDEIGMPDRGKFFKVEEFYATMFHEMAHSTGHENRLKRDQKDWFGGHEYGIEELVAEMTASFLCGHTGIFPLVEENSGAYIRKWMENIKENPKMVIKAGAKAQKAFDFILHGKVESVKDEPDTEPMEAVGA